MDLRKIIREAIGDVLQGDNSGTIPMIGDALTNIEDTLSSDLNNINTIVQTHKTDLANRDNEIKANMQLKSKLDAKNPHKKGLEREIPEDQKDFENRKKQLKDLEKATQGMIAAKSEIEKQRQEIEKKSLEAKAQSKQGGNTVLSVLPSLESPI